MSQSTTDVKLLPRAVRSNDLLESLDGSDVALDNVQPMYRGIFGFITSARGTNVDLELLIEATADGKIFKRNWSPVESTKGHPSLEIFMTATQR